MVWQTIYWGELMDKKKEVKKKIDIVMKLYEDEDIIYTGNLDKISTLQEASYLTNVLQFDMEATRSFEKIVDRMNWYNPLSYIMRLIQKIINVVSKKGKHIRHRKTEKEKILTDIETLLRSKSDINDFSTELNKLLGEKEVDNLSAFADKACVDYSYLNKIINRKLPDKTVVSRDFTIKLCLALELDLNESNDLISRAGYVICGQNKRDIVVSVCLQYRTGVMETNLILDELELKPL